MVQLQKHERVVVGLDPALSNLGMVKAVVDGKSLKIVRILDMRLVKTIPTGEKGVIKNHDRMRRGRELLQEIRNFCYDTTMTFAEIPEGAQDANAAMALALVMGVLCACPNRLVEVRPREVKAITGFPTADKEKMRQWAYDRYPTAPWKVHSGKKTKDNEHLADAVATVEAGLQHPMFRQYAALLSAAEILAAPYEDELPPRRRLNL